MSNIDAAKNEIVDKWTGLANDIAKLQVELKDLKASAKEEGYNLKCLAQVVKERRKGAEFQCAQLTLELEMNTYRASTGLPTTLEDAQKAVMAEKRGGLGDDDGTTARFDAPFDDGGTGSRRGKGKRGLQ